MRKWGLHHRLHRGSEGEGLRNGTDERLARPRMTGDGHPYLWRGLKFKVESVFGTDERPARPRMTGTVIRTFNYFAVPYRVRVAELRVPVLPDTRSAILSFQRPRESSPQLWTVEKVQSG